MEGMMEEPRFEVVVLCCVEGMELLFFFFFFFLWESVPTCNYVVGFGIGLFVSKRI